jgi:hypothetical protein
MVQYAIMAEIFAEYPGTGGILEYLFWIIVGILFQYYIKSQQ